MGELADASAMVVADPAGDEPFDGVRSVHDADGGVLRVDEVAHAVDDRLEDPIHIEHPADASHRLVQGLELTVGTLGSRARPGGDEQELERPRQWLSSDRRRRRFGPIRSASCRPACEGPSPPRTPRHRGRDPGRAEGGTRRGAARPRHPALSRRHQSPRPAHECARRRVGTAMFPAPPRRMGGAGDCQARSACEVDRRRRRSQLPGYASWCTAG